MSTSQTVPGVVRIEALRGSLELHRADGSRLQVGRDIRGVKQVGLIAGLITTPRLAAPNPRRLAVLCYGDDRDLPHNWTDLLSQGLSRMRNTLGLPVEDGSWRLMMNLDAVDIQQFAHLANHVSKGIQEASFDVALEYCEAALDLWQHDPAGVVQRYTELIDVFEPTRQLHRRLLLNRVRALQGLRRIPEARELLAEALDLYPNDHSLKEHHQRLSGLREGPLGADVLHNLPLPDGHALVGREAEERRVREVLRPYPHSQHPALTIDGVGGVGKTALAKRIAYDYVARGFSGGDSFFAVVWTSAKANALEDAGIQQRSPTLRNLQDIYSAIAMTVRRPDILAAQPESHDRLIRELLSDHDKRVLLIVDNLETVDDQRVIAFLRDLPAPTKVIVTTRHRLEGALPIRLEGLQLSSANALAQAAAAERGLVLRREDAGALCEAAGGIPLAILWTVGQLGRSRTIEESLRRLRSASGDYARFAFHESVGQLAGENQSEALHLLYAASLFAEDASREALGFAAGLENREGVRDQSLGVLLDLSLLNLRDGRYSLLPLTREFVAGDLGRDLDVKEPCVSRWMEWHQRLADLAAAGAADLDAAVIDQVRTEHGNLLWAIDYAMRQDEQTYASLVRSMEFYWLGEGLWAEFDFYVDRARVIAPLPQDKIHFTGRLMWLAVLREDFEAAQLLHVSAEHLLRRFDVPYERMRLADFKGQASLAAGDLESAESELLTALELATTQDDRRGIFATSKYLGELYCRMGRVDEAKRYRDEAERHVGGPRDIQWDRGLAHIAHLEALIGQVEEEWGVVVSRAQEGLGFLEIHPDVRLATQIREVLAVALRANGATGEACDELDVAARAFEQLGMWRKAEELAARAKTWREELKA